MITNRTGEYLKLHADIETEDAWIHRGDGGTPGAIIAEFASARDACLFRGLKGPNEHCVTAGISHPYAVRRLAP